LSKKNNQLKNQTKYLSKRDTIIAVSKNTVMYKMKIFIDL